MKKIGVTGSIGSGKSTVTRMFSQLGIPVYDADSRARILMVSDAALIANIKTLFSEEAYLATGELNRPYISAKAFQDKELLTKLNGLVHPAVFDDFELWCSMQHSAYCIKEAALMFESNSYKQVDEVIIVTAPEDLRIKRAIKRDGVSKEAIISRMKNQYSQEEKRSKAQYEIKNDEQELVIPQVLQLHRQFSAK